MKAERIKDRARGDWPSILSSIGGLPRETLDGNHHPCPTGKCSSQKDAFRFTNLEGNGGAICNQCGKFGDGIALLQFVLDIDFKECCKRLSDHLGDDRKPSRTRKSAKSQIRMLDPKYRLPFAREWLRHKEGIELDQLMRTRWAAAEWPRAMPPGERFRVLAFQTYDPIHWRLREQYILYQANGEAFPKYGKLGERKAHIVGKGDGLVIVGTVEEFKTAKEVWKHEGITDALATSAMLIDGEIAVANVSGSQSFPPEWRSVFDGKLSVVIVADNDPNKAGEIGADKAIGVLMG